MVLSKMKIGNNYMLSKTFGVLTFFYELAMDNTTSKTSRFITSV